MDLSEETITVHGDDCGGELGDTGGAEQSHRGGLHEEESVRPSDEDERLLNDRN